MATKSHADVLHLFERVGRFYFADILGHPDDEWLVIGVPRSADRPGLYAWVEEPVNERPTILYIGKAGKSVWRRHRNHEGGFHRSLVGKRHLDRISKRIRAGVPVNVWVHYPKPVLVDGERIPVHSSLEDHLLASIEPKPVLNREGRSVEEASYEQ